MPSPAVIKVLFVCTGNICRSPTAEAVFRHIVREKEPGAMILSASAGTHAYHVGEGPDTRAVQAAKKGGISMEGIIARRVRGEDFQEFDYILAMDRGHYSHLNRMAPVGTTARIALFMEYSSQWKGADVPDPYYGGVDGFDTVLAMIQDGAEGLLDYLSALENKHDD